MSTDKKEDDAILYHLGSYDERSEIIASEEGDTKSTPLKQKPQQGGRRIKQMTSRNDEVICLIRLEYCQKQIAKERIFYRLPRSRQRR